MKIRIKNFSEIGEKARKFILGERLSPEVPTGFYVAGLNSTDKKEAKLVLNTSGYT
jgi:hypothetical protein